MKELIRLFAIPFLFLTTYEVTGKGIMTEATALKATIHAAFQSDPIKATDFEGKLDELLTLEMAAAITGFETSKATKEHGNKTDAIFGSTKKGPRECSYLWNNGRTRTVRAAEKTMNVAWKDKVSIKSVSNTTLERFRRNYGVLTDAEKQVAADKLRTEAGAHQPERCTTDADAQVMEVGTGLIAGLKAEEIGGVGEAATWYANSNEIKVFYNGLIFALVVDISDNPALNREKSIELAKMIIREKLNR